jgi:hypothetical protein
LQSLTGLWVLSFEIKDLRHNVLGIVEEAEVLIALSEHPIVRDDLQFLNEVANGLDLAVSDHPVRNKP